MSTETPPKLVPSFDHLVTQWMSHGTVSKGSSWNSSQVHWRSVPTMPSIRNSHASVSMCGVGPAVSTGKPRFHVLPGRDAVGELLWRVAAALKAARDEVAH